MSDLLDGEEVFFYHGTSIDGYRFTIAGRFQPMLMNKEFPYGTYDPEKDQDVIMLGISLCGKCDQFAKKLGRMKAEGRMKAKSIVGRSYFSLYQETRPLNWFAEKKGKVFVEAAQLNNVLSRTKLMRKFNL